VVLKAVIDLGIGLPVKFKGAWRAMGLDQQAGQLCRALEVGLAPVAKAVSLPGPSVCTVRPIEFVFCFLYCLVGVLLPCHLTYWYELNCRALWLEAKMLGGGRQRLVPAVQRGGVVLNVLASLALTWVLCSIWAMYQ
jgi:hypothetical protein